jgi:hypothetical protein
MIADHIPEAAQAARLGHRLPDKIQQVYSHVAPELRAHLLVCLQRRWTDALANHETTPPVTPPGPRPGLVLPAANDPGDSDHRAVS